MPDTPIDLVTFKDLQDTAGADFVVELVDTFLEEAPVMLAELQQAFAAANADAFRRAAHSLKSNSNTFGALTLGTLARDLELGGLETARRDGALQALAKAYEDAAAALKALCHG
jgi:histidine phosphotransfer protein HptB